MAASIVLGIGAVVRRDFVAHGAWMTRAYAIGMGAGTQVVTHLPWFILVGKPGESARTVLMGAGWVINIVVAEWIIRSRETGAVGARNRTSPDVDRLASRSVASVSSKDRKLFGNAHRDTLKEHDLDLPTRETTREVHGVFVDQIDPERLLLRNRYARTPSLGIQLD